MTKEMYQHTRNYGCRIRSYTMDGISMLSMENSLIKVVFAVSKGTDIVELLYKPQDVDFMWHSFNPLKNAEVNPSIASTSGSFLDSYSGGWQELFPTYGGNTIYSTGEIGVHGEACIYPWEYQILEDTQESIRVLFSLRTIRSPFLLEKTVTLQENSTSLGISQKVTNLGMVEQHFMWGHHPAFGFPFLDDSVKLHVPGTPKVKVPEFIIGQKCPFDKETEGTWPFLPDKNGVQMDMSRAHDSSEKLYYEYALSGLESGEYELINHRKNLGIRMTWDQKVFKYLWVWCMFCGHEAYPWYGRAYTMAVEPWSSMPANFTEAEQQGDVLSLKAGESMSTWINAEILKIS